MRRSSLHSDLPETGLPPLERSLLGGMLRLKSAVTPARSLLKQFAQEANWLLEIVDEVDYDIASMPGKIPRITGIEHSSRRWSLFMVLDHLVRSDRAILEIIRALREEQPLALHWHAGEMKPDEAADNSVIETFQAVARDFQRTVHALLPLRTVGRFAHPWFGPLDAHGWTALAAARHRVHRRQARKILAVIGIT